MAFIVESRWVDLGAFGSRVEAHIFAYHLYRHFLFKRDQHFIFVSILSLIARTVKYNTCSSLKNRDYNIKDAKSLLNLTL